MTERTRDGVLHEQDGSGNLIPQTFSREVRPGEAGSLDRALVAQKVTSVRYTATTAGTLALPAGSLFFGVKVTTPGTSTTVTLHDNASAASGRKVMDIAATPAAGSYYPARGAVGGAPTVGIQLDNGGYLVIGGSGSPDIELDAVIPG